MITPEEARLRVQRGAAHLDTVRPSWFNQIDIGTLTLHDSCGCIVGQLCHTGANFGEGLRRLDVFDSVDFGMEREALWPVSPLFDSDMVARLSNQHYSLLQDAWIDAIADRRLTAETTAPELTREAEHTV